MTRLQLALDQPEAMGVLPAVRAFVDIVEVGTPLLKRFGLSAITSARDLAPGARILADSKTVDGGAHEARMFFGAGADLVTVLTCASPATHESVADVARTYQRGVVVDTLTDRDPRPSLGRAWPAGISHVALHTPTDARVAGQRRAADTLATAREYTGPLDLVLAGGLDLETLPLAKAAGAAVVVVGRAITAAENPGETAARMYEAIR